MLEQIKETAAWIKEHTQMRPRTAIVLGTGLGHLAEEIDIVDEFPYQDIPNFPISTVEGHAVEVIHEEVQKAANAVQPLMAEIFREMVRRID